MFDENELKVLPIICFITGLLIGIILCYIVVSLQYGIL